MDEDWRPEAAQTLLKNASDQAQAGVQSLTWQEIRQSAEALPTDGGG